jgi:hypothetical protein
MTISGDETTSSRSKLTKLGAYTFACSVVIVLAVAMLVGYEAIVWPTVLLVYPSLMLITGTVGLYDLVSLARSRGRSAEKDSTPVTNVVTIGRGVVFSAAFLFFVLMEIKVIRTMF